MDDTSLHCCSYSIIVSKISMKCRTRNMSTKHCTRGKYAKCCIGLQYFITDSLQKTAYITIMRCSSNKVALRLHIIIWLASRLPGKAAILTRQLLQSLSVLLALLFLCHADVQVHSLHDIGNCFNILHKY